MPLTVRRALTKSGLIIKLKLNQGIVLNRGELILEVVGVSGKYVALALERHGHMSIERFSDYEKRIAARDSTAPILLDKGGDGLAGDEGARALGSGAEITEEMK
jgi:hypothetical protein